MRAALALIAALWAGAACAQPHDMSKMQMGLPPMPSVYAGEADKPGAPVFKGLGDHHMAVTATPERKILRPGREPGVRLATTPRRSASSASCAADPNCAALVGLSFIQHQPGDARRRVAPAWAH